MPHKVDTTLWLMANIDQGSVAVPGRWPHVSPPFVGRPGPLSRALGLDASIRATYALLNDFQAVFASRMRAFPPGPHRRMEKNLRLPTTLMVSAPGTRPGTKATPHPLHLGSGCLSVLGESVHTLREAKLPGLAPFPERTRWDCSSGPSRSPFLDILLASVDNTVFR